MAGLWELHGRFLRDTIEIIKFNKYLVSAMPSLLFISSSFLLVYNFCHRHTRLGLTSKRAWFFREMTFHWSYFYLCKLWFLFIRAMQIGSDFICDPYDPDEDIVSPETCKFVPFSIIIVVSLMPGIMMLARHLSSNSMPNFLLWIGEDHWVRSEIGIAGHYLDRPPTFAIPKRSSYSYRTRRSCSAEEATSKGTYLRVSKSMELSKCVKDVTELY